MVELAGLKTHWRHSGRSLDKWIVFSRVRAQSLTLASVQIVASLADFTPEVMLNAPTKSELVASDLTQTEPMASSIREPGQGDAADQGTP